MKNLTLEANQLIEGVSFSFPSFKLTEQEIIDFALLLDPQKIHIDKAFAEASMFGGIISSGAHPYHVAHKKYWIPLAEKTFLCGLYIRNWDFLAPIYPEKEIHPTYSIIKVNPSVKGNTAEVQWLLEFFDSEKNLLQSLDVGVLHSIKG
ncbi:MAG: acyl dehydratase [Sphingobacteriales bacterium]|jgi:acyl dehydratase